MIIRPSYNTTFTDRFQKAVKFYDYAYHLHKSTFKGLNSFYKQYSEIEKYYADSLMNLSKSAYTQIPELSRQNQSLVAVIKQVISCIQTTSQLHFNYAERLTEVSQFYNTEYYSSKRKKDNHMKMIKDRNEEQYYAMRDREKNRNVLNAKQKDICKVLYENLDKLAQQQNDRIHKIKEQTIIYFSLYKKVCQKQLEWTSQYNLKLVKQQFQVKNPKITQISEQIRTQYNQYGGDQIASKNYDTNKSMNINRQSLRASIMMREKASRLEQTQNKLKRVLQTYEGTLDSLLTVTQPDTYDGLFDPKFFGKEQKRTYSRQLKSQMLKNISYDMIQSYCKTRNSNSDQLTLLQLIKASLRVKTNSVILPDLKCQSLEAYWSQARTQISDQEYLYHLAMLQQISRTTGNYSQIDQTIHKKQTRQTNPNDIRTDTALSMSVRTCIIDILLESLCVSRPEQPVLAHSYIDYMELIANFGENFLSVDKSVTVLLLLRKLDRLIVNKDKNQQIQQILQTPYFLQPSQSLTSSRTRRANEQYQNLKYTWSSIIVNSATQKLVTFYRMKAPFLNYLKILFVIERLGLSHNPNFNARNHFYMCIRYAGFNYMRSSAQCVKFFNPQATQPQQRLKYIVEGIQQLDYQGILSVYFNPATAQTSKLLGVGEKIVKGKLFDEFTHSTYDLIDGNLSLLSEQEGVDRNGYVLRLGIIFAKLDIENPQPITQYEAFFQVLKKYLQATQKDYDTMLQHSRQTQLWIMQQNSLATPNCIDFCSLLYKPFQFLLISLKELQKSRKTEYTRKYSQYIKLRLNTVLKTQIIKYVNFLYESLAKYRYQPAQLTFKPRRLQKPHILKRQQMEKERQFFKQLTRRMFNLLFLKEQLQEMVCDFIDPQIKKKLDNSILNLDKLNKISGQLPEYRDILGNIKQIVQAVVASQQRIVMRVASITVFQCMSKIFDNLYYQQQKNAIQQFFSNAADYKLSQHTFLKYQEVMEDWFTLIARNIPTEYNNLFQMQFARSFFYAIQSQVLNSTKFKLPLKLANVVPYLDSDVAFVTTLMKQKKIFEENTINQQIKMPFKELLGNLQAQTAKLASAFQTATLKNDKQKCKYILTILNLRAKDQKAIQFVKRYKSIGV